MVSLKNRSAHLSCAVSLEWWRILTACTKCSRQASLVQRCCEPKFCTQHSARCVQKFGSQHLCTRLACLEHFIHAVRIRHHSRETAHDRRTNIHFRFGNKYVTKFIRHSLINWHWISVASRSYIILYAGWKRPWE